MPHAYRPCQCDKHFYGIEKNTFEKGEADSRRNVGRTFVCHQRYGGGSDTSHGHQFSSTRVDWVNRSFVLDDGHEGHQHGHPI